MLIFSLLLLPYLLQLWFRRQDLCTLPELQVFYTLTSVFCLSLIQILIRVFEGVENKYLSCSPLKKQFCYLFFFNDYSEKNCSEIWEAFKNAFINKDPCNILPKDYELFINLTLHTIPPNKVIIFYVNCPLTYNRFYMTQFKSHSVNDLWVTLFDQSVVCKLDSVVYKLDSDLIACFYVWLHLFYAGTSQQCLSFHTTEILHFSCCAGSFVIVPDLLILLFLKLGALATNAVPAITFFFYSSQLSLMTVPC